MSGPMVKAEGVQVEDTDVRLVAPVGHRRGRAVDLDGAVVALRLRACPWSCERNGQAGSHKHHTEKDGEIRTPCNGGHATPPVSWKLGLHGETPEAR